MPQSASFNADGEPPAYEVVNEKGTAPFLLICDHSSNFIPRAMNALGLSEVELERHVAFDIGAASVAKTLSTAFDAPLVRCNYSRLIIDPNRVPGTESSIPRASEDVVVPGNHDLTMEEANTRRAVFFDPYHDAITAQVERFLARGATPAIISVHSFTPAFHGIERPWHVGVLWHLDKRIALPLIKRLRAEPDLVVGDNEPYSGSSPEGYSISTHAESRGFPNVLVEIRQDLIDTPEGVDQWSNRLGHALHEILADSDLYAPL